jgi:hypothetical protein
VGTTELGGKVTCEYGVSAFWMLYNSSFDTLVDHQNMGWLEDGDRVCPQFSEMDGDGC